MKSAFYFSCENLLQDSFVIRVPKQMRLKQELMQALKINGEFPNYFGENWDALLDCLTDFHWVQQKRVVILHEDLPLVDSLEDCQTYIEILSDACQSWNEEAVSSSDYPCEFIVVFPKSVEPAINGFLT